MNELKKGARLTLRVDRLSLGGDAVGRAGGAVVFVPYGCPGDTLDVELIDVRRNFARARLLRVVEASPVRQDPPCPYHFQAPQAANAERGARDAEGGKLNKNHPSSALRTPHPALFCGGCSWQHIPYPFQLDAKRQLVQETLERIGGIQDIEVKPTLGMQDPWRYRNKVQQPVGWDGDRAISGFYAPGSHDLVPIEDCLVQPEVSVKIVNRVRSLLQPRHRGWLKHLLIRTSQKGEAQLVFVTQTSEFPHERQILEVLAREFPPLTGIHQNVNPGKSNVILGREWRKCAGADTLEERLGPLRFQLSPGSFFQVNSPQAEVLYDVVKDFAGTGAKLIDLYCGVGGIALWLAPQFEQIIGVDEFKNAIFDAQKNAVLNDISNARFVASPTERFLASYKEGGQRPGGLTVVLDPPRAGCDPKVLGALSRLKPSTVVYVSCDPGTLARDLSLLGDSGFRTLEVQPVDLFPHTAHIETVARLSSRS